MEIKNNNPEEYKVSIPADISDHFYDKMLFESTHVDKDISHLSHSLLTAQEEQERQYQQDTASVLNYKPIDIKEINVKVLSTRSLTNNALKNLHTNLKSTTSKNKLNEAKVVYSPIKYNSYDNEQLEKMDLSKGKIIETIHSEFDGNSSIVVQADRIKNLLEFIENPPYPLNIEEKEDLNRLVKHRTTLYNLTKLTFKKEAFITSVIGLIDQLDQEPYSEDLAVTLLKDGSKSFSIISGCRTHDVSYEFKKEVDGTLSFIIHNRGAGADNFDIHGDLLFNINTKASNKSYTRINSRISIPADKKHLLQDRAFLANLLDAKYESTMDPVYAHIKKHLIDSGEGAMILSPGEIQMRALRNEMMKIDKEAEASNIQLSDLEEELQKLNENLLEENLDISEKEILSLEREALLHSIDRLTQDLESYEDQHTSLKQAFVELIKDDPSIGSLQKWGSCSESCLTNAEKTITPKKLLYLVNCYRIDTHIQNIANDITAMQQTGSKNLADYQFVQSSEGTIIHNQDELEKFVLIRENIIKYSLEKKEALLKKITEEPNTLSSILMIKWLNTIELH